jgi:hypothetical protein
MKSEHTPGSPSSDAENVPEEAWHCKGSSKKQSKAQVGGLRVVWQK